jgi:hypothetical protein
VTRLALFDFVCFFGGSAVVFILFVRNRSRRNPGRTISGRSSAGSFVAIVGTLGSNQKLVLDYRAHDDFVVVLHTTDDTTLVGLLHEKTDMVGVQILLSFPVVSQVSVGGRLFECDCTGEAGLRIDSRLLARFLIARVSNVSRSAKRPLTVSMRQFPARTLAWNSE